MQDLSSIYISTISNIIYNNIYFYAFKLIYLFFIFVLFHSPLFLVTKFSCVSDIDSTNHMIFSSLIS